MSEIKTLQSFALVAKFNDHMISLDKIGVGGMIQEAFQKTGRLDHWLQACRLTIESPISGWGPGGFMRNLGNIYYRYKEPFSFFDNANNQYLQMSSDLGFLGAYLNLFLHLLPLLMIIGIHRNIRSKEERWAVGISFSVVSIMMLLYMTGPHIMAPDVLFIMVIYLSFLIVTAIKFGFSFKHFNIKRYAVPIVLITALFSFESYNNAFGEKGYTLRQEANWWPLKNHYGYYPLEKANDQMMMWTGKESSVQIPAKTNLVNINILTNHYNTTDNGLFFKVFIDGTVGIEHHFFNGDYKPFYCFVPNIKSREIQVKTWVDKTFSPQKMGISKDDRDLGVMISPLNFLVDILPKDGIGFYRWETASSPFSADWPKDQQFKFRWTNIRASIDIDNYLSNSIILFLLASHPDLKKSPVTVQIIGEKGVIKEVVFTHYDWQKITMTPAMLNGSTILTLQVSRTWNPKLAGVSEDARDLGVAVAIPGIGENNNDRIINSNMFYNLNKYPDSKSLIKTLIPDILLLMDFSELLKKDASVYAKSSITGQKVIIEGNAKVVDGPNKNTHALMIDGNNDFTRVNCSPLDVNTTEGTFSIWARLLNPQKERSCLIAVHAQNRRRIICIDHEGSDGKFNIYYNSISIGRSSLAINDDAWHQYVFTWRDGEQRFYIDGQEVLEAELAASTFTATAFGIGWRGAWYNNQWHGAVASFFTFNRTLTKAEINLLYRN